MAGTLGFFRRSGSGSHRRSCSGNVAVMTVLALVPIVGVVGLAIETAHYHSVRAVVQNAIDLALLASSRGYQRGDSDAVGQGWRIYRANIEPISRDLFCLSNLNIRKQTDAGTGDNLISGEITCAISTLIGGLFGVHNIVFSVESEVFYRDKANDIEIVFVLDFSQSMNSKPQGCNTCVSKMQILLSVVRESIISLRNNFQGINIRVGIVPFAHGVSMPDESLYTTVTGLPTAFSYSVMRYNYMHGFSPGTIPYERVDASNDTYQCVLRDPQYPVPGDMVRDFCETDTLCTSTRQDNLTDDIPSSNNYFENNVRACDMGILPMKLASDPLEMNTVLNFLDMLLINGASGSSNGEAGILWGWNVLSPKWNSIWSSYGATAVSDYDSRNARKVMVVVSDGEFNDPPQTVSPSGPGISPDPNAIPSDVPRYTGTIERTGQICDGMKARNIILFMIAFDIQSQDFKQDLADCASQDDYFYDAHTEQGLTDSLSDILSVTDSFLRVRR